MGDITKLPRWAQQKIETQQRDIEYWKNIANAGPDNSDTFIDRYISENKPLGERPTIVFLLADGNRIQVRLDESRHFVYATSIDHSVVVQPQSSNVVRVGVQDYWR